MIMQKLTGFDFTKERIGYGFGSIGVGDVFYVSGPTTKLRGMAFYHAKRSKRKIATMRVLAGMKLGKFVAPSDGIAIKRLS